MLNGNIKVSYIEDKFVDDILDNKIRALLTKCFPYETRFLKQRFAADMPKHRFIAEVFGELIGHIAIHEKSVIINNEKIEFLGIAEVCVDAKFRGQGLVKALLEKAESIKPQMRFLILLGKPEIYHSSGYFQVNNIYFLSEPSVSAKHTMVKCLNGSLWTSDKAVIEGVQF